MLIKKVTVPIGVIGIIYESRPDVTSDVSSLCLKSGNVAILRGGSESLNSNRILANLFRNSLSSNNVDKNCIQFIDKEISEKKLARAIGFSKWQQLSDEDFYIIREKDIITVSSMNKEVIFMYEAYIHGADGLGEKKSRMKTDPSMTKGYIGKIDEARKRFEKIFKEDPKSP